MSWKKIILSGSSAELSNINVTNAVTASFFKGDGSALTNVTAPGTISSSAQIASDISGSFTSTSSSLASRLSTAETELELTLLSGSEQVVSSLVNQQVNLGTGAITASIFKGDGSLLTNITVDQNATVIEEFTNQTSVAVTHNFGSKNVLATVYNSSDEQIIPGTVTTTNDNVVTVTFDTSTSGRIIVGKGGHVVSGSIPFANLIAVPTLVSSSIAGDAQGQIKVNGVNVDVTTLQSNDSPTFASLTLTGDLTVQGTTTSIQTTNLLVEDKFIVLNSGSANPDEGGILIDEGGAKGHAYVYDSNETRFGFTSSLSHSATSVAPDAFVSAVVDIDAGHTDIPEYQKNGNIKTDSGTVWIYA